MTTYFLDSSALIKRYVEEMGTEWVLQQTDPASGNVLFVAHIAGVEIISGLTRKMREGQVMPGDMQRFRSAIAGHLTTAYPVVTLDEVILERAEELLVAHPLRAYDAVQLASALTITTRLLASGLESTIFVSADRRLLAAAEAEGLITDDPNRHA